MRGTEEATRMNSKKYIAPITINNICTDCM